MQNNALTIYNVLTACFLCGVFLELLGWTAETYSACMTNIAQQNIKHGQNSM